MSRVEYIKKWVSSKQGRYSDLTSLYGSEIVYALKESTMREETYNRIMSCIKTIENVENGKLDLKIDRNDTCYSKKDMFFDYFYNNPKQIDQFKLYSRGYIDVDAILNYKRHYSSYIHDVFLNFINGKDHPLKDMYDILESSVDAKYEFDRIYSSMYNTTDGYFIRQILQYQSFRKKTLEKIDAVIKAYKDGARK